MNNTLKIILDKLNKDYDSYVLSSTDKNRISPLIKELQDLSFKYFITIPYYHKEIEQEKVVQDNKRLRFAIRNIYKSNIRMWFFIEKHTKETENNYGGFHRHILIEDVATEDWNNLPDSLEKVILDVAPDALFAINFSNEPTEEQKIKILKRVCRFCKSVPNGNDGLDIRPIHNVEKLIGYCTKQVKSEEQSYEVIDNDNSDLDNQVLAHSSHDNDHRLQVLPFRTNRTIRPSHREQHSGLSVVK